MKVFKQVALILLLALMTISLTYAWFDNTSSVMLESSTLIRTKSSDNLEIAFSSEEPELVLFGSDLSMDFDGNFEALSGGGQGGNLYKAEIDLGSEESAINWSLATADLASLSTDSGQYAEIDVVFKSAEPMDIYLDSSSKIDPCSNESFSKNYIAGATRVAFMDPDADAMPSLVWVPNSCYQLLGEDSIDLNGTPEEYYCYYVQSSDGSFVQQTVERANGKLKGELYLNGSPVENTILVDFDGEERLVPAIEIGGAGPLVPAFKDGEDYVPAVPVRRGDVTMLVKGEYIEGCDVGAIVAGGQRLIQTEDGYAEVTFQSFSAKGIAEWVPTGICYTDPEEISLIESSFIVDTNEYSYTKWVEDNDLPCKIASTSIEGSSGCYYKRVKIIVWVELTDREADESLFGGEFNISLSFSAVKVGERAE